jgi:DNA-binding transcriptional ArsR family regulator
VAHIAQGLPVSRPAVSQHIKILNKAKLIHIKQEGTRNICSINEEGVVAMRDYLDQFWGASLASFKELAEVVQRREQEKKEDGLWY